MDGQLLREWPALEPVRVSSGRSGPSCPSRGEHTGPVTAALFRADAPEVPYRHVLVWPQREMVRRAGTRNR